MKSIQEELAGIADEQVLQIAKDHNYIILTFDKDYRELNFRYQLKNPPAVVYFREKGQNPLFAGRILLTMLKSKSISFENSFTVIKKQNLRQRFYKNEKSL